MKLSKDKISNIVADYHRKKISKETLKNELGMYEEDFHINLIKEFENIFKTKDAEMLDDLMTLFCFWENEDKFDYFLDILHKLLMCDWHWENENIVNFLQDFKDERSIDYLYKAVSLDLKYFAWDTENYTFKVKCVKAIREIAREKGSLYAMETLELLCDNENQIVREVAKQAIEKVKNSEKRY